MTEQQRLDAIRALLPLEHDPADVPENALPPRHLLETHLDLIYPSGASAAFAYDEKGHVAGFKFGSPVRAQRLIDLVSGFPHLQRLVLHTNETVDIPTSLGELSDLRFLSLSGRIRSLPETILQLGLRIEVSSHSGQVDESDEMSEPVAAWQNLHELLSNGLNKHHMETSKQGLLDEASFVEHLDPSDKLKLKKAWQKISLIHLSDVSLQDPPIEIVARGAEALSTYFRDRGQGALSLREVKVLFVGHGSAGKTSLVKRLVGQNFDPNECQTHGINIRSLRVGSKRDMLKANMWDFGGQEIMHATHQFFLSKRSLYVLVLDGRKDEDPEYWLQHIESFGGDSPVIVVLNKMDQNPAFDLNRRFLSSKYESIVAYERVSCFTGDGIRELKSQLRDHLARAPMVQTSWPRRWYAVKRRLQKMKTEYISLSDYENICGIEGVTDEASRDALVEFLHDLGVFLHFRDLQLLDTHVLNPRWVTVGVYRIINSKTLADQKGYLRLDQLREILNPESTEQQFRYPPEKHTYLVELMLKFELCYRIGTDAILVPDLLSIQEPATEPIDESPLRFLFRYAYLPKSVMPRLTVRMHKDIKDNLVWRTGVVLTDRSFAATAVVRADEKSQTIQVVVEGQQKRDYFAVIRKAISDINANYEKLSVTEQVPLPDRPDVLLDYAELIGHELAAREEYFVGRLSRGYSVKLLLNGIEAEATRQHLAKTIINVQGSYINQSGSQSIAATIANSSVSHSETLKNEVIVNNTINESHTTYTPQTWEKIVTYATAVLFVGTIVFLLIRNVPIADKNLVVALRVLLSIVIAIFGASVPGMLHVDLKSKRGMTIRASGALALFVVSFFATPRVL